MSNVNVERQEHYTQVCVWPATLVEGKIEEFVKFFVDEFNGTRIQYLEEIKTGPDLGDSTSGGRNDVFFAVHSDDVTKFAVPRLQYGIRWIEDVLSNEQERTPDYSIYPARVKGYCSWTASDQGLEEEHEEDKDFDEVLDDYFESNKWHHFEGPTGLRQFEHLVQDIGYDNIYQFLEDNPGAVERMIDHIREYGALCDEWKERIKDA